jgi:hypothetical protein
LVTASVLVLLASLVLSAGGCGGRLRRALTSPAEMGALDKRSPYLKAHMRDGRIYVLSQWTVDEASQTVSGTGEVLGLDRDRLSQGSFTIPVETVALFETNVVQKSPAVAALTVITGVSVAVTLYCVANPKSCFGSCPTFYVSDGTAPVLQAEGFSGSVAPALEARDVDALYRARPSGRDLRVVMKNEALETHVVRHVHLLAAPRPAGGRVFATESGEFWQATEIRAPLACRAEEGDCLAKVRAFDGEERFGPADGEDLARREEVELLLPGGEGPQGLVIAFRQTLLSTFVFYQSLAYLGRSAGVHLAALERGDTAVRESLERLAEALGGIEILLEDSTGRWVRIGQVQELGPIAGDVKIVPLPSWSGRPAKLRLRMSRGHWRIDYVALARLGARVEPLRLRPVAVGKEGGEVNPARGGGPLTTLPGDIWDFDYRLPEDPLSYELFLESRGYYLEWMRQEWMAEEDPLRAARLFLDPAQALKDLAPLYKKQEARMEDLFWGSRFARP